MPMNPYRKLISATLSVDESNLEELALLEKTMDGVRGKVPDALLDELHQLVLKSRAAGTVAATDMLGIIQQYQRQEKGK